ncbi:MAG: hypothetical protein KatS3mg115_1763 [Candidatus Poribacteria bacterium]|nr:MAG: hypothetical protein KatS3mg115_1763 [Candidatus Poribacteria bacterium]
MKTPEIRIIEPYRVELVETELPERLGPHQVRIRTLYSAISSGTELAVYTGTHQWLSDPNYPNWRFPFRAGYSSSGVVEAVGEAVSRVRVGDRVVCAGNHGATVVLSERSVWPDPHGVRPELSAFTCIARYGMGAAARIGTTMGRSVFVLGLGVIGQFALRSFVAAGAYPVVGLDLYENRRQLALQGGATAALDPTTDDFAVQAAALLGDCRAEVVADATGLPKGVPLAMSLTRDGGKCVVVGSPRGLADGVNFYPDLHRRSIEVIGAHGDFLNSPIGEALGWNVDRAMSWLLAMMATERLPTLGIPTEVLPPERAPDAYDRLLNDKAHTACIAFDWTR